MWKILLFVLAALVLVLAGAGAKLPILRTLARFRAWGPLAVFFFVGALLGGLGPHGPNDGLFRDTPLSVWAVAAVVYSSFVVWLSFGVRQDIALDKRIDAYVVERNRRRQARLSGEEVEATIVEAKQVPRSGTFASHVIKVELLLSFPMPDGSSRRVICHHAVDQLSASRLQVGSRVKVQRDPKDFDNCAVIDPPAPQGVEVDPSGELGLSRLR